MGKKLLQDVSSVLSESLSRKIGESDNFAEETSFISETNYCGMSCVLHLWLTYVPCRTISAGRSSVAQLWYT
jgi:hypothetical protein